MTAILYRSKTYKAVKRAFKTQKILLPHEHSLPTLKTPCRAKQAMCDLIPKDIWENIESTFLEPACGNGNFIAEILERKYARCEGEKDGLKALSSVFGIDIQQDNVSECRRRLLAQFLERFPRQAM